MTTERGTEQAAGLDVGVERTEPSKAAWLKAIIEAVGDEEAVAVSDIEERVGSLVPSPESPPIEEYVKILLNQDVLAEAERSEHVQLTEAGRNILEGILSERAAENGGLITDRR